MNFINEEPKKIPVSGEYDVAVCGGGIAGIAAALSAAREHKSVLLIENQFMLGGLATAGLITFYLPLCDGEGHQVSFGICEELIKLSVKHGYEVPIPTVWREPHTVAERAHERYNARYNAHVFAVLCEQLLIKEGVKILYGSRACAVKNEGGRVSHIIIESKGGRKAYKAGAVVDATGDADICALAGLGTEKFSQGNSLAAWHYYTQDNKLKLATLGFCDVPDENGNYSQNGASLSSKRYYGIDEDDLSDMVTASHKTLLNAFLKGGEISDSHSLVTIATVPQVRMTRRITGDFTLDTAHERQHFNSSVGMFSDWRYKHFIYELPFGTLRNSSVKNLFCAGRCISVTDAMWDITRVIPVCAVSGEAAGIAAAISAETDTTSEKVADVLKKRGIPLHVDEII